MKRNGAPVEGIGFQGHFRGHQLTHPQRMIDIIRNFSVYRIPIHITEFDVETDDEQLQADFMRDVMTVVFSSPGCTAFVMWGYWENDHWRPKAAIFRKDWSKKKAYYMYKDLVFKKWWTDVWLNTNSQGYIVNRVFKGQYNISVDVGGRRYNKRINLTGPKGYYEIKVDSSVGQRGLVIGNEISSGVAYPGHEPNAPWRGAAEDRINRIRKGTMKVYVQHVDGRKIAGARVRAKMIHHKFIFASYIGHKFLNKNDPSYEKVQSTFKELFNGATTPIYWKGWSAGGKEYYTEAMQHLKMNQIPFKASPIICPQESTIPDEVLAVKNDQTKFRKAVLDHVKDVAQAVHSNGAAAVDVIHQPGSSGFVKQHAGADIYTEIFKVAKQHCPNTKLILDENQLITSSSEGKRERLHQKIELLKQQNTGLRGIGIQGHVKSDASNMLMNPQDVLGVLDAFASRHKIPVEFTQFDVKTDDEQVRADYTRDMLTVAFSHPWASSFTVWGWWQGEHWLKGGAMLKEDFSPKPNYHAWKERIFGDWWTDISVETSEEGEALIEGFKGYYEITVDVGGGKVVKKNLWAGANWSPLVVVV